MKRYVPKTAEELAQHIDDTFQALDMLFGDDHWNSMSEVTQAQVREATAMVEWLDIGYITARLAAADEVAAALEPFAAVWDSPEPRYPHDKDYKRAFTALRAYEATKEVE